MIIKLTDSVVEWTTYTFVQFFYSKCDELYGEGVVKRDVEPDCARMKWYIDAFERNNRSKRVVYEYILWAIMRYRADATMTKPVSIGFLRVWINEYLGVDPKVARKAAKKPVNLSPTLKAWVKSEKAKYLRKLRELDEK